MKRSYEKYRSYGHTRYHAFMLAVPIGPFLLFAALCGALVGWNLV